jgi:hypothetical protein
LHVAERVKLLNFVAGRRAFLLGVAGAAATGSARGRTSKTVVTRVGEKFFINGRPTYAGRRFLDRPVDGLLLNSRMVQGIFDDLNPETRDRWAYPDTGRWDPERNTDEFVAAMSVWRQHGLLSFTINLQGGSPEGYSKAQPWITGAIDENGALRPAFMKRLARILDRADQLGMVPVIGIFYFGQDQHIRDEAAVKRSVRRTARWILSRGYRNVLLEIANECDIAYDHGILRPDRIHELITLAKNVKIGGQRLLTSVSYSGGTVPSSSVVAVSDYVLLHGNGVSVSGRLKEMVAAVRTLPSYRPMPIMFNEDDHFDFESPGCNMAVALSEYASWGYFDPGKSNYVDGYQCPPINWGINTPQKRSFFGFVKKVTDGG